MYYLWPPTLTEGQPVSVNISVPTDGPGGQRNWASLHVALWDEELACSSLDVQFPLSPSSPSSAQPDSSTPDNSTAPPAPSTTACVSVLVDPRETGAGDILLRIAATPATAEETEQ